MFDITVKGDRNGESDFYGPNEDFKIKFAGLSSGYGGAIILELSDNRNVLLGHFTEMSSEVIDAYKSGEKLKAGTYLGNTSRLIGSSSGAHVHGEGWTLDKNGRRVYVPRNTTLKWLEGKK